MLRRGAAGGAGQPEQDNDVSRRVQRQEERHEFGRGGSAERYSSCR